MVSASNSASQMLGQLGEINKNLDDNYKFDKRTGKTRASLCPQFNTKAETSKAIMGIYLKAVDAIKGSEKLSSNDKLAVSKELEGIATQLFNGDYVEKDEHGQLINDIASRMRKHAGDLAPQQKPQASPPRQTPAVQHQEAARRREVENILPADKKKIGDEKIRADLRQKIAAEKKKFEAEKKQELEKKEEPQKAPVGGPEVISMSKVKQMAKIAQEIESISSKKPSDRMRKVTERALNNNQYVIFNDGKDNFDIAYSKGGELVKEKLDLSLEGITIGGNIYKNIEDLERRLRVTRMEI